MIFRQASYSARDSKSSRETYILRAVPIQWSIIVIEYSRGKAILIRPLRLGQSHLSFLGWPGKSNSAETCLKFDGGLARKIEVAK
jgi:hypothetical protein